MKNLPLHKINDEVFIATESIVQLDYKFIQFVKEMAICNSKGRARICTHKTNEDNLHEMIIAIRSDSYVRPHRHPHKIESFHLIEGRADVVIFDDQGSIEKVVKLGSEHAFYYRLDTPRFHTLIVHSPVLVIHEITNGPFDNKASEFAEFSVESENVDCQDYLSILKRQVACYLEQRENNNANIN